MKTIASVAFLLVAVGCPVTAHGQSKPPTPAPSQADRMLAEYFRAETERIEAEDLKGLNTPQDWQARRPQLRSQLLEMLGLDPLPEKTDLKATVTGTLDQPNFRVEKLHFQSRPGLYVTGNLYLPKNVDKPAPAVLYVCGHSSVKKGTISYGNKTAYQHHAAWFASNGFVCLVIDTLQLGEIVGIHHGTYRENMWWWLSRGYTPAGVEAWNCVRALDYLQTRKEVDGSRLGVTGRSGGGAYSWWLTGIDDRIKAAVPVAGITDLHNHVVDGAVEGHCDCMFMVNTHRWDYPTVAAMAHPRALQISNTDKDRIFPLDGVQRLYWKVRDVYTLGATDEPYRPAKNDLGLQISEGGHVDSPELQVAAFRWMNRFLKGKDEPIDLSTVKKAIEPEQLRVFKEGLPGDAINPRVHDTFVPVAPKPQVLTSPEAWAKQRDEWTKGLREKVFRGWPAEPVAPDVEGGGETGFSFTSQPHVRLRADVIRSGAKPTTVTIHVGEGAAAGNDWQVRLFPRGAGPNAWGGNEKKQTQIRRRFMLLGQTLEGMQVWDVRRAVAAVRSMPELKDAKLRLTGRGEMAGIALYAALFEPGVDELELTDPPASHMSGPHFLNVLRVLDMPQAIALAAEKTKVRIRATDSDDWAYPVETAKALKWPQGQVQVDAGR